MAFSIPHFNVGLNENRIMDERNSSSRSRARSNLDRAAYAILITRPECALRGRCDGRAMVSDATLVFELKTGLCAMVCDGLRWFWAISQAIL
jgi:hypothetical protein